MSTPPLSPAAHLEAHPVSPDSILFNDDQAHRLALDVLAGRRDGHIVLTVLACWVVRHLRDVHPPEP